MTPEKIKALRAVREGGKVDRADIKWLHHWQLIDGDKRLTIKGTQCLADYEEENTGD